ncbi:Hydrolase (HAD superfamily) [Streptococcus sp. DD10]|uniref:Cof-type HAD-IIB family hydrolase n=1 Tax=Streptococcus sp. DD10 TaxID=1777878 RepID=UPI0007965F66|nr:Cof-type HAD-IIB family hydrolase [Streptococcus sp. DD10]KXT74594.1 Hydrolase (HAD superfamily) [Streptococcus sp. DD10]
MEIKAVFFDIDGTLVNDSRTVLKSTEKAILALQSQGILVGLATGRGPHFVKPFMEDLNLDFAVTYNGQYVYSREKIIFASPIAKSNLRQIIDYAIEHKKEIAFGTEYGVLGSKIMTFGMSRFSQWTSQFIPGKLTSSVTNTFNRFVGRILPQNKKQLQDIIQQPIYQVLMLSTKNEIVDIERHFPDVKFTRSSPYASDLINKGVSKLEGIKLVGEEFGFDMGQVMAFGDSDNDLEMLSGVGLSIAMGNGTSKVKEIAQHTTTSNTKDGIHKALEHFGLLSSERTFLSQDGNFNKVKDFHGVMDGCTQEKPIAWEYQEALYRTDFKLEELVEFMQASSSTEDEFDAAITYLHQALDKAADKARGKRKAQVSLTGQVDALVDTLYLTYGTFTLMGVDPKNLFDIVHRANLGKIFPDGRAHFDPVTHKILKPEGWEEKYAPEPAIKRELERQLSLYHKHHK